MHALLFVVLCLLACSMLVCSYHLPGRWHPTVDGAWMSQLADKSAVHRFWVGLTHSPAALHTLRAAVSDVSNPQSINYGAYLSVADLHSLLSSPASVLSEFESFFYAAGAESVDAVSTGDAIAVLMRLDRIESALNVRMEKFVHKHSGRWMHRTLDEPKLPPHLQSSVQLISGLMDFHDHAEERRLEKAAKQAATNVGDCPVSNAPQVVRIRGGADDITGSIYIYCQDGSVPTATLCAEKGNRITFLIINYQSRGYPAQQVEVDAAQLAATCTQSPTAFSCPIPHTRVVPYQTVNVTAYTLYWNGRSASGSYPTRYSPSPYVTPQTIHSFYGVPKGTRGTNPANSQAVSAFELQYIDADGDVKRFFEDVGLEWTEPTIQGQNDPTQPGGESTLDITYISAVAPGVPTTFVSVTGPGPAVPPGDGAYILEFCYLIGNESNPPLVTSHSYGDDESGYYNKFNGSYVYIDRTETELMKMAARGLTVIAGSGDAGATNVGEAGNDISPPVADCSVAMPFYPSNSHYVTSLSATFFTTNALPICDGAISATQPVVCDILGERAVSVRDGIHWTTGGGFGWRNGSNTRPDWQAAAVDRYLKENSASLPPPSFFAAAGRGYADVSMIGHNLLMYLGGSLMTVDGTSASGPVFAGLVSLWNDALLNAGLPPAGFLNPFLYQAAANNSLAFNDIVTGSNYDGDLQLRCSTYPIFCTNGFVTARGWDAVTGLGTPNWLVLKDMLLQAAYTAKARRQQRDQIQSQAKATDTLTALN